MKHSPKLVSYLVGLQCLIADVVMACDGEPSVLTEIGQQIVGYGRISALLAVGIFYLQLRRMGLKPSTIYLLLLFIPIYVLNEGWHYKGIAGDCGAYQSQNSYCFMLGLGGLLGYQIVAATLFKLRAKVDVLTSNS